MLEIKKLDYSYQPWRLLKDGKQVYAPETLFTNGTKQTVNMPVSAATKKELIAFLLRVLEKKLWPKDSSNPT